MTDASLHPTPLRPLDTLFDGESAPNPEALSMAQACEHLIRWVPAPVRHESVLLPAAHRRILATDLIAPLDLPPYDCAAMDGYAVRAADLSPDAPTELSVAGRTLAGDAPATLPAGHAQRIMTGAPMPAGADTVIMQERVQVIETGEPAQARIIIPPGQHAGQNIRRRGEDLQQGAIALPAGSALSAIALGVAASLGHTTVDVFRPLRVGVFSTGNELVQPGQTLAPGQIHDSNRPTLLALVAEQGWQPVDLGSLPDDPARLGDALQRAAPQVDVLLTTGGAAGGDADLLQPVLSATPNSEAMAWKLRLRPGRPLVVGRVGQTPLFGLPGNPVAATLSFLFVIRSALQKMAGLRPQPLPRIRARAGCALRKRPGRLELMRVRLCYHPEEQLSLAAAAPSSSMGKALTGTAETGSQPARAAAGDLPIAHPTGSQSSALLRSLFEADGIAILPEEQGSLAEGDLLDVVPLRGLTGS
ncbi:molybdopterin molybdenumtransferase MoeA [Lautropia dentalis]|jgi:molybdopterin molybdochelatase|uniref:Molybdopterin molybdenumtransferase n=1 Tax=Lautropia dentalis TaxID=2490857 RepID=A0A3R8LPW1_9BURK|nr:gephyrin-like molybdotransferase Glp [Lautropia dentalis]RRN45876.1 molybdopterin molybdenumtransferase MoeA [Lautropia dentalis]